MKKIFIYFLFIFTTFFSFINFVNAEDTNAYSITFANRSYNNFPFTTFYNLNENTIYDNIITLRYNEGVDKDSWNPPKYLYLVTCASGFLDYYTNSTNYGNVSNKGNFKTSMKCDVNSNYNSYYYLNRFLLTWDFPLYSEPRVGWRMRPLNTSEPRIDVRFESVFLSNELILENDFASLLNSIKSQNNNILGGINSLDTSIQENSNRIDNSINNLNDNISNTDTSSSENHANSFFENFQSSDFGLSDVITLPLTLINSLTNATCISLKLQVPFINKNIYLPCMSSIYSQYFGSFFNIYQIIIFGFTSYWVCIRIYNLIKDFKNPDHDEIEVLDL